MNSPSPTNPPAPGADGGAPEPFVEQVYQELRTLAERRLAAEPPGQTLQATALVHEAWLRLGADNGRHWNNRQHFYAAAAGAMRRILIDQARRRHAERHGGGWLRLDVPDLAEFPEAVAGADADDRFERIDAALEALGVAHPEHAELVRLRYFTGLTLEEAAAMLGVSPATAKRHWTFARAWLFREFNRGTRTR